MFQSSEVLEFVKNDLNEISAVVKSEASSVINSTTNVIKDTFKVFFFNLALHYPSSIYICAY